MGKFQLTPQQIDRVLGAHFEDEPADVRRILALSWGWFGVSRRRVRRLERKMRAEISRMRAAGEVMQTLDNPRIYDAGRKMIEQANQHGARHAPLFAQALAALEIEKRSGRASRRPFATPPTSL